jgi:Cu+-exporting ATPase
MRDDGLTRGARPSQVGLPTLSWPEKPQRGEVQMEKDPVCGMRVDPTTAAAKSEYQGKTYYFCSPGCKTSFDKSPEAFVSRPSSKPSPR